MVNVVRFSLLEIDFYVGTKGKSTSPRAEEVSEHWLVALGEENAQ